ncbi:MAG TPA: hypothetical protein VF796_14090 [Humisphaera sp.]
MPLPELDPITLTPTAGLNLNVGSGTVVPPRSRPSSRPSADDVVPVHHSPFDVTSPLGLVLMGFSIVLLTGAFWYALRRK